MQLATFGESKNSKEAIYPAKGGLSDPTLPLTYQTVPLHSLTAHPNDLPIKFTSYAFATYGEYGNLEEGHISSQWGLSDSTLPLTYQLEPLQSLTIHLNDLGRPYIQPRRVCRTRPSQIEPLHKPTTHPNDLPN